MEQNGPKSLNFQQAYNLYSGFAAVRKNQLLQEEVNPNRLLVAA